MSPETELLFSFVMEWFLIPLTLFIMCMGITAFALALCFCCYNLVLCIIKDIQLARDK